MDGMKGSQSRWRQSVLCVCLCMWKVCVRVSMCVCACSVCVCMSACVRRSVCSVYVCDNAEVTNEVTCTLYDSMLYEAGYGRGC